jgi:hypothetical protein
MKLLAIDPGSEESALLLYDVTGAKPLVWAKLPNAKALDKLAAERGRSMGQVIEDAKRIEREFGQEKRVVVCERCGHTRT